MLLKVSLRTKLFDRLLIYGLTSIGLPDDELANVLLALLGRHHGLHDALVECRESRRGQRPAPLNGTGQADPRKVDRDVALRNRNHGMLSDLTAVLLLERGIGFENAQLETCCELQRNRSEVVWRNGLGRNWRKWHGGRNSDGNSDVSRYQAVILGH